MIYFPYIALLQPILIFIIFRAYFRFLTLFVKKPISQSNYDVSFIAFNSYGLGFHF